MCHCSLQHILLLPTQMWAKLDIQPESTTECSRVYTVRPQHPLVDCWLTVVLQNMPQGKFDRVCKIVFCATYQPRQQDLSAQVAFFIGEVLIANYYKTNMQAYLSISISISQSTKEFKNIIFYPNLFYPTVLYSALFYSVLYSFLVFCKSVSFIPSYPVSGQFVSHKCVCSSSVQLVKK